jgi:pimeloyl-ACP methyl ester carboxylesterase
VLGRRRALSKLRRWGRLILLVALVVPTLALGGFVLWAQTTPPPMPEALAALEADSLVRVTTDRWLVFEPANEEPTTALVLYPGARVDPRSYAPPARAIAREGYLVVIVPMPLNLAVCAPDAAADVISAYPDISQWTIGGHSLGGAMAARFAYNHPTEVQGLVLWAAYPDSSNDLSHRDLAVTSIYATRDGLATTAKIDASRPLLPPSSHWVVIEGGNHAQFGWYGPQSGDNPAIISQEQQQRQVVQATLELLVSLD